jgi:branched-chain amino acid transport system ATP-binding protein
MAVLEARELVKDFRGFRAVDGVDLTVEEGVVHALVGPNGAGKATLFNLLTGFLKPEAGTIRYRGETITGLPPNAIARRGLARSFQFTSLFEPLSILEHVALALQAQTDLGYRFRQSDRVLARFREEALAVLAPVGLEQVVCRVLLEWAGERPAGR